MNENVVLDAQPEVSVDTAVENLGEGMPVAEAPKVNVKKGLLFTGLVLTGLVAGYGIYRGVKWGVAKVKAKKAAKVTEETDAVNTEA